MGGLVVGCEISKLGSRKNRTVGQGQLVPVIPLRSMCRTLVSFGTSLLLMQLVVIDLIVSRDGC